MQKYAPDEEIDNLCDEFERLPQSGEISTIESFLDRVDANRRPRLFYWLLTLQLRMHSSGNQYSSQLEACRRQFPEFTEVIDEVSDILGGQDPSLPKIPNYTIERLIKRGGQGAVYRALQDQTGQHVAIKLLSTTELKRIPPRDRSRVVTRLKQEVRTAAALKHPNVIKIYDAGECDDGFYFVMQLVDSGTLAERTSGLSQIATAKIIHSVAGALQEAHASGVLHLDVKPHNILFDEVSDGPLLADFGLARFSQQLPSDKSIAGTIGYMAPEQAMGEELDVRTDVYGLGATLYYMLTGKPPYLDVQLPYNEKQRQSWTPLPPRTLSRDINAELEKVCMKCLEFDRDSRYQNCLEVAQAIDRFNSTEDGHRIAKISARTLITSPLFLLINLAVFGEMQMGWANVPHLEPLIWATMFSMYAVVFFVIGSTNNLDKHSPDHLAIESLWAIWLAKLLAAFTVAGCFRFLASGLSQTEIGPLSRSEQAILMCYPMFSALTGFALATMAPRYWRMFYVGAVLCWLHSFVLMSTIAANTMLAPVLYGAPASAMALIWGLKLRQLAREQTQCDPASAVAPTMDFAS